MSDKYKNSDISMNAEEKLNILIAEYHSLKTEVEKKGFDEKMQHTLSEMSSEERSRNYLRLFLCLFKKYYHIYMPNKKHYMHPYTV